MTVRKTIGLVISIALILGGCYIAYLEFFGPLHRHYKYVWVLGPFFAIFGLMWIYSDWIEKDEK